MPGAAGFVAGPYALTLNSISLGLFRGDQQSPLMRIIHKSQRIEGTNGLGASLIDWIYVGRDCYLNGILMEPMKNSTTLGLMFPFGTDMGQIGPIGQSAYDVALGLVMTAAASSLAATNGGFATITASKAVIAPDFSLEMAFGPNLREAPLSLSLLPYVVSSNNVNLVHT